ncbi:Uncharacterised protein [Klebsiella quasipneumoniae]|nr:Uncharacterised protein [Klebsiella quasipneumoniae]
MFSLKSVNGDRVIDIHCLNRSQCRELIVVLQNIFSPQVFAKQFDEGFFLFFRSDICRVRKAGLQLTDNIDKTTTCFTRDCISEAFHVFGIAFLHYHAFGIALPEQGNGINGRLL